MSLDAKGEGLDCEGMVSASTSTGVYDSIGVRPWRRRNALLGARQLPRSCRVRQYRSCEMTSSTPTHPQDFDPGLDDESSGTERLGILESVVSLAGFSEARESSASCPVELASVDNDSCDDRSVSSDPLGRTLDDDVGPVCDGLDEVASLEICTVSDVTRSQRRVRLRTAPKVLSTIRGL